MRLIQLTDCHLLADPQQLYRGFNTHDCLSQVAEHLKNTAADAFIFTGDLSQDGSAVSYQYLHALLDFTDKPIYALPGNHDDAIVMREQLSAQCVHSAELGNWQVLLLDSQVTGEAFGEINQADLNWLSLWLKTSTGKPTLIAIHHQPLAVGSQWTDDIMLQNGDQLLNILKGYADVKGLIFGHVHQEFDQQFGHIRIMGCPSTCFQFKAKVDEFAVDENLKPGYRWLELNDDGSLETGVTRLKSWTPKLVYTPFMRLSNTQAKLRPRTKNQKFRANHKP